MENCQTNFKSEIKIGTTRYSLLSQIDVPLVFSSNLPKYFNAHTYFKPVKTQHEGLNQGKFLVQFEYNRLKPPRNYNYTNLARTTLWPFEFPRYMTSKENSQASFLRTRFCISKDLIDIQRVFILHAAVDGVMVGGQLGLGREPIIVGTGCVQPAAQMLIGVGDWMIKFSSV